QLRLHLEDAAGDGEVQCLATRLGHHDLARLEPRDQRRVARRDAELAHFAGDDDHCRLAVEDFLLGADDVATDCGHVTLASLVRRESGIGNREWYEPKARTTAGLLLLTIPDSQFPEGCRLRGDLLRLLDRLVD